MMRVQRYNNGRGHMPRRITALFLATTMTLGAAPAAFAADVRRDVSNSNTQTSSPVETVYVNAYTGEQREINFNDHWRFSLGDTPNAHLPTFNDAKWNEVTLPHDYSVDQTYTSAGEAESGFLPGGAGWYRKTFTLDPTWKESKRLSIHFDGVYMNAEVYLNGEKLGSHPYGYTAFSFELPKEHLQDGENVLAVKVDNKLPSSRWYSGSGIYRDVTLTVTDPVHVAPNGVTVTTPNIGTQTNKGLVEIATKVNNDGTVAAQNLTVKTTILEKSTKKEVGTTTTSVNALDVNGSQTVNSQITVADPKMWNVWDQGDPDMYVVHTEIKKEQEVLDTYETEFGFRHFEFDQNNGFSLNGKAMKLRGVCMHHDQGALGSEAWRRAIERQVETLKKMGCNAIRVTHNPAAESLIEICNEQGMLVIDEAFDTWTNLKNGNTNDYAKHFNQPIGEGNHIEGGTPKMTWAEYDTKAMVERGKNAPSVIMWSLGNEIFEGLNGNANVSNYHEIAKNLVDWVKQVDSTRPTTFGQNNNHGANNKALEVAKVIHDNGGVIGLNYSNESKMTEWNKKGWKTYGSETASAVNSRGVYAYKGPAWNNTSQNYGGAGQTGDQLLTSYDKSRVGWGAVASDAWWRTIRFDYNAGEFVWTGFDYLGEPTPWNNIGTGSTTSDFNVAPKSSYFGIIETTGFPKDSFYLYQSQWNPKVTTLHVLPTWNEDDIKLEDGKAEVVVYSDAPVVKLYLNGNEIGVAQAETHKSKKADNTDGAYTYQTYKAGTMTNAQQENTFIDPQHPDGGAYEGLYATFKVPYQAGTLTAKAFKADGTEITENLDGRHTVETTKAPTQLELSADRPTITADGKDLSYITIDVKDQDKKFVNGAEPEITVNVTGNGKLLALDNGKQADHTPYTNKTRDAGRGKLLAIVQSTDDAGEFTVTASANGLKQGSVTVTTTEDEQTPSDENAVVSVEHSKNYYVKVGNDPQLPAQIKVNYKDGRNETKDVTWDTNGLDINNSGLHKVNGTLQLEQNKTLPVSVNVMMMDGVTLLKNYSAAVAKGSATANLPQSLPAILEGGQISEAAFEVQWDESTLKLNEPDTYVVEGTAQVFGETMHPTATIRVSEGEVQLGGNVAPSAVRMEHEPAGAQRSNELNVIRDGRKSAEDAAWEGSGAINFGYDTAQGMTQAKLYLKNDADPSSIRVRFSSSSGGAWEPVKLNGEVGKTTEGGLTVLTYSFSMQSAERMRLEFDQPVQLVEAELYVGTTTFAVGSTDKLESLRVGEHVAPNGALDRYIFNVPEGNITPDKIKAVGKDNASVTVLPAEGDVIRILTESEDHSKKGVYTINLNNDGVNPPAADDDSKDYDYKKMTASALSWNGPAGGDGPANYAIDNRTDTWWHTNYGSGQGPTDLTNAPDKRYIQLDLAKPAKLNALRYLPRKGPDRNGIVTKYRVEVSTDNSTWTQIATGDWDNNGDWKLAVFDRAVEAKHIRLYGETTKPNNKFMTAAEIRVCLADSGGGEEAKVERIDPVNSVSIEGFAPLLPSTVTAHFTDGTTDQLPVTWKNVPETSGTVTVEGTVEGTTIKAQATVRFVPGVPSKDNLALNTSKENMPLAIGWVGPPNDDPFHATDGKKTFVGDENKKIWTDWEKGTFHTEQNWMGVILGSGTNVTPQVVDRVSVGFMQEDAEAASKVSLPKGYEIQYYTGPAAFEYDASNRHVVKDWSENNPLKDPNNWKTVKYTDAKPAVPDVANFKKMVEVSFEPVQTSAIRISLTPQENQWVGLEEFEVYGLKPGEDAAGDFEVQEITVDGKNRLADFDKNKELTITLEAGAAVPTVAAKATNNATVQIKQSSGIGDDAVVTITPENGNTQNQEVYTIHFMAAGVSQHTVRFETNGGTEIKSVQVSSGERVTPPQEPEKSDHLFTGWFTDAACTNRYDFDTPVTADLDLYAGWKERSSGGGGGSSSSKPDKKPDQKPEEKPEEKPEQKPEDKPVQPEASKVEMIPTVPGNPESIKAYTDVNGHWAKDSVSWAVTNQLFKGTSATQFAPDSAMTRGMLVTVLHRLAGQPQLGQSTFRDVPANAYYNNAVAWASTKGLVSGVGEGLFAPNSNITREQLAVILYKFAGSPAVSGTASTEFQDAAQVSGWAKQAMEWALNAGLIQGAGANTLAPQQQATRAQVATILMRFEQLLKK